MTMTDASTTSNGARSSSSVCDRTSAPDDVENRLDALFDLHEREQARAQDETSSQSVQESPIDRLRSRFSSELLEVFQQLQSKYESKGVTMSIDAQPFLSGGRNLSMTIVFTGVGIRLDGVVTSNAIAFSKTQFTESNRGGVTSSGPSLRVRELDAAQFRKFICDQIAHLVQSLLRQRCPT